MKLEYYYCFGVFFGLLVKLSIFSDFWPAFVFSFIGIDCLYNFPQFSVVLILALFNFSFLGKGLYAFWIIILCCICCKFFPLPCLLVLFMVSFAYRHFSVDKFYQLFPLWFVGFLYLRNSSLCWYVKMLRSLIVLKAFNVLLFELCLCVVWEGI